MNKVSLFLLIVVLVLGAALYSTAKRFDSASPLSNIENLSHSSLGNLVNDGELVAVGLLDRDRAAELLQSGDVPIFTSSQAREASGRSVVILCPGHSDYVKNSIQSLKKDKNWKKIK